MCSFNFKGCTLLRLMDRQVHAQIGARGGTGFHSGLHVGRCLAAGPIVYGPWAAGTLHEHFHDTRACNQMLNLGTGSQEGSVLCKIWAMKTHQA